ncbi:hypothetical protein E4T48_00034 [Aureobasidium sp. EXF-10727]|nr:hypothetical protein E4T48_00034 [Aureobasidium sp. EXF-10727]
MSPLASALDVQWILQEPCLVTWKDKNRELKTLGLEPHPTTLWAGVNKTERTWAVMLQRTIAFQYARRFKPSDFFVFLDPRGLHIENEPITTDSNTLNDLLHAHQNSAQNGWLGGRVSLGQLQTPGRVLMRQRLPEDKAWEGMPLHLLMEIQSLSRASEFNIYVRNKKTVRGVFNRLRHELPKTLAPVRIDLDKAFDGRGGVWDAWESYSRELVGLQRLESSRSPVAPPSYSVNDPNATRASQSQLVPSSLKRSNTSQEIASSQKRVKDDKASWEWYKVNFPLGSPTEENTPSSTHDHLSQRSTVGDQIVGDVQSTREDDPLQTALSPHLDKLLQGHYSPPGRQLTPVTPRTPEKSHLRDLQGTQTPPYAASVSATSTASLDQLNIRPTVFTTRPQAPPSSTITLTLSDLERLISTTIKAQIPAIAAEVQTRALATELTAWAEPSISDYITTHMPAIMQDAVAAHVCDVNDEFDSASAALHEVKDEATTEIKSIEASTTQAIHREYQVAVQELQEQSQRLSEVLDDKCTELEDRLDAKMSSSAPPGYSKLIPTDRNSVKDAVKMFERSHRGDLTEEEQVRVLLSIAKFSNAEVFVAAGVESRKMLIAHWSGKKNYIPPSSPLPYTAGNDNEVALELMDRFFDERARDFPSISAALDLLQQIAEHSCCAQKHRNKFSGSGLAQKLAIQWLNDLLTMKYGLDSWEAKCLEQEVLARQSFPVEKIVKFVEHTVFEDQTLASNLCTPLDSWEDRDGLVYIFTYKQESFSGMIKIGYTCGNLIARLNDWWKCGHGYPALLYTRTGVIHPKRVELLTHFELLNFWHEQQYCNIHGSSHVEWFKTDAETAYSIISDWAAWMESYPYDRRGQLKAFWTDTIDFLELYDIEITAKTLLQIQWLEEGRLDIQDFMDDEPAHRNRLIAKSKMQMSRRTSPSSVCRKERTSDSPGLP